MPDSPEQPRRERLECGQHEVGNAEALRSSEAQSDWQPRGVGDTPDGYACGAAERDRADHVPTRREKHQRRRGELRRAKQAETKRQVLFLVGARS